MNNKLPIISYTLAAMASICFVGGLVILSSEGRTTVCTDLKSSYQC